MLKKVIVNFQNCYGIRSLKHTFDFSQRGPMIIYAPNGVMKTSFAKSFQDLSSGKDTVDRVYPERETVRLINDQDGKELSREQIFVIEPYNQTYRSSKISTLLVHAELKKEYDEIYESISRKLEDVLKELRTSSGIRKDVEKIFVGDFNLTHKELLTALGRLEREIRKGTNPDFAMIKYQQIFHDKIVAFLNSPDFLAKISEYTTIYDKLLSSSTYFKKGIFNHNNASVVAKNLKQNGWFDSGHSVTMKSSREAKSIELQTEAELEKLIQSEKDAILQDKDLNASFEKLDKELQKNVELREFREFLIDNKTLIPELENVNAFKQKIWIAYLTANAASYTTLMTEYDTGSARIGVIVEQAKREATKWLEVIDIFNERFSVPFVVRMDNQDDVILRSEAPIIKFDFKDSENGNTIPVEESKLYEVLSNGEKRALYILNIIFEVQARKEAGQETLFVIDDIADSFDYKNKYAIIEYLKDIAALEHFHQIILSHNFDFFRTASSRLSPERCNKLHSVRTENGIRLVTEKYQKNPFMHWKDNLKNPEMLIASIPFVRNLSEYCGYGCEEAELTALLHIKTGTKTTTIKELEDTFNKVLSSTSQADLSAFGHDRPVIDLLMELCKTICSETEEVIELEKKIVLAIGIRLKAEEFIIKEIADDEFVNGITNSQTYRLVEKYKQEFPDKESNIKLFERVNIMTPENIHLNSFMYEPILDMSNESLKKLCVAVDGL
ncbi:phage infection protein [Mesorhizobium sp. M0976]|uniref:hypothetical protein n=1 Tax=Mesorhizobium sp. M0976 TaxID=2957038 RepID=UPI003335EE56